MKHPVSAAGHPSASPSEPGPLSRPTSTDDLPHDGIEVVVTTTPEERAALARDFGLVAIDALVGRYVIVRRGRSVTVKGRVEGEVTQTCVVTLEPFQARVAEEVDVKFVDAPTTAGKRAAAASERPGRRKSAPVVEEERHEHQANLDDPDPIVEGRIDLGALTAEFLALGLDPYPRKPGVAFAGQDEAETPEISPFAALQAIRTPDQT